MYTYGKGEVDDERGEKARARAYVPKGSGGRSDGGTVVAVVAEQRGVTWGVRDLGPGPSGPGWRRRKCAAYIRPGTDGNQHPVHSWTHPEHRESKNASLGTSAATPSTVGTRIRSRNYTRVRERGYRRDKNGGSRKVYTGISCSTEIKPGVRISHEGEARASGAFVVVVALENLAECHLLRSDFASPSRRFRAPFVRREISEIPRFNPDGFGSE